MKNIYVTIVVLIISIISLGQEATNFTNDNPDGRPHDPRSDQFNFVPNEVLVKFKDNVDLDGGTNLKSAGISNVDNLLRENGIKNLTKLFPDAVRLKSAKIVKDPTGRDLVIPSLHNIYKIELPNLKSTGNNATNIHEFIDELKELPEVEYAEPNYTYSIGDFTPAGPEMTMEEAMEQLENQDISEDATGLIPNDPLYNQQWGIPATNIDDVWDTTTGDSTSIIAILDTGVDWLHPDLAENIWSNKDEIPENGIDDDGNGYIDDLRGWDFINNDNNPTDDNSHGTHVAGIAAAVGNNEIGIAGVNWNAKILPVKVFQSSGKGDAATIAEGVTYAAQQGATVINMSFGSYIESATLRNALANAYASSVLVAAAGNDGRCLLPGAICEGTFFPACYSFVLGVQANDPDEIALFSNKDFDGPVFSQYVELLNYELSACGVNILSTIPNGNYRMYNGTSMAAPLVSGAISLYKYLRPESSTELLFGDFINSHSLHIDIEQALNITRKPIIDIVSYEIIDTLDGDGDGRADVGETIELIVNVRNSWGQADEVFVGVDFADYEDNSVATLMRNEANIGSISSYATKNNTIPLKIKFATEIVDGRDCAFDIYAWYESKTNGLTKEIIIKVENGIELDGIISEDITLYPDKHYIVSNNLAISSGSTLTIKPGTTIKIGEEKSIVVQGNIIAEGTPDSLITFTKRDLGNNWGKINNGYQSAIFKYVKFEYGGKISSENYLLYIGRDHETVQNCIFENNEGLILSRGEFTRNVFYNNNIVNHWVMSGIGMGLISYAGQVGNFSYNNIANNIPVLTSMQHIPAYAIRGPNADSRFSFNCVFNNGYYNKPETNITANSGFNTYILDQNFYGSGNLEKIRDGIYDFEDNGSFAYIDVSNKLPKPPIENHGLVWKVLINDVDSQEEFDLVDPIGVGQHRFDVYFNRPMDIEYPPVVSMGVRYPYTQTTIAEEGEWSADSTIYTVYGTVGLTTGDGLNTIRVSGAKDTDHFEIPIEDRRFKVIVDAAGSASTEFKATAGLGNVNLEWESSGLSDELGFNMYRMEQINDSTLSDPVMINSTLITDTLFTDEGVTPQQKYFYYYKVLRSNFAETDSSKTVAAIPFTAQIGDANGDLEVSVLDITTIVDKVLGNTPDPFYEEAADVNYDGQINILDIIATINMILSNNEKSGTIDQGGAIDLYIQDDTLFANATTNISAFQFEFYGVNEETDIERLPTITSFELASKSKDNSLNIICYSLTGKTIEKGNRIPLFRLGKSVGLTNFIVGDSNGNPLAVNYNETSVWNYRDNLGKGVAELGQNFPNPHTGFTTIPVKLNEPVDEVTIRIVNMMGQQIAVLNKKKPILGDNFFEWQSTNSVGIMAYILEINRNGKHSVCGVQKMIVK